MNFFKFMLQNPHLIWIAIVIAAPVVRGVLKKLGEQSAERSRQLKAEQQRLEAMRTGINLEPPKFSAAPSQRTTPLAAPRSMPKPPPQATSARAALEDLAAARRADLARGRVLTGATASVKAPPKFKQRLESLPNSQIPNTAVAMPSRPPKPPALPAQNKRPLKVQPSRALKSVEETSPESAKEVAASQISRADPMKAQMATGLRASTLRGLPRSAWKRAIVMQEVMSPPLSLR